jgi:hypothetical protein
LVWAILSVRWRTQSNCSAPHLHSASDRAIWLLWVTVGLWVLWSLCMCLIGLTRRRKASRHTLEGTSRRSVASPSDT